MIFRVEGRVRGKQRARTFFNHNTGRMQSITPLQTKSYEDLIRWNYKISGGEYFEDKAVKVSIKAFYSIPQAFSRTKREQALQGQLRPQIKPDTDNILKVVLDALNGIAYYDDKQVISVNCEKWYAEKGYLEIEIKEIEK